MPSVKKTAPKVALVHDYLREYGGAERVLEALHALFPEAPVYTAFVDEQAMGNQWQRFAEWDIRTTWMQRIPGIKRLFSPLRILAPHAFAQLDLSAYDIVISSTNAYMAKAVQVPNGKHICYCHTPPRSLYGYSTMSDWKKKWWIRLPGELINHVMRMHDFRTAQAVAVFIANSKETARRIQKFYRRESVVIYPPVTMPDTYHAHTNSNKSTKDPSANHPADHSAGYYVYVNRLAFAKHPEIAVQAALDLGFNLKVVGTGPMLAELEQMVAQTTATNVIFLGSVSDETLQQVYAGATALLYPVEDEDFGIVPIEAMGHGVPVIAHASGGPLETIIDGETGVLFDNLSVEGLKAAITILKKTNFDQKKIARHASVFNADSFQETIRNLIANENK